MTLVAIINACNGLSLLLIEHLARLPHSYQM